MERKGKGEKETEDLGKTNRLVAKFSTDNGHKLYAKRKQTMSKRTMAQEFEFNLTTEL
jgi:hypothetical protein